MPKDRNYKQRDGETDEEEEYGCFTFRPRCLQGMNNIKGYVFWLCVFNFWEGFIVNGVINVILVALETRYSLSSTKSGLIASANDFGAFVFLLLVGYFGEKRHKPRIMTLGILMMTFGCFIFTLPHFIGGKYPLPTSGGNNSNLCVLDSNNTGCGPSSDNPDTNLYPLFLLGQILLGIGAAPLFTIGLTYVDENTEPKMTSLYTGLVTCSAAVGVAAGYVVGGQTMSLFVDINHGIDGSPLTTKDRPWVGAWWIGTSISIVMLFLVAFPIFGYPRRLPGYDELVKKRKSEAHKTGMDELAAKPDFGTTIRDFPKAILLLLRNPTFLLLCMGGTCDSLIVGGTATFGAKLLQEFHNVDLSTAGWIMGAITVPGSGGGMILGGYLVKRMNLKCKGILRLCALFTALSLLFSPSWLVQCEQSNMAGVKTDYNPKGDSVMSLTNPCNEDCSCTTGKMDTICTDDGLVYFSPCYAGCLAQDKDTKEYRDCQCFDYLNTTRNPSDVIVAKDGDCTDTCNLVYVFCLLFFLVMICTFGTFSPNVTAVFRCVPYSQRSLAIGFELLFIRLAGTTPGPILFGFVIDDSCSVWEDKCGEKGSCWVYENSKMGKSILYWWMALKATGVFFYLMASIVYKSPPPESQDTSAKGEKEGQDIKPVSSDSTIATTPISATKTLTGNDVIHDKQNRIPDEDPSDKHKVHFSGSTTKNGVVNYGADVEDGLAHIYTQLEDTSPFRERPIQSTHL